MQSIYPDPAVPSIAGAGAFGDADRAASHTGSHAGARRPTALELTAALLLAAAFVLHVVAMFPHYFGGAGAGAASIWSQSDQATEYAILAAGWAVALGIGLSSPARAAASAFFAVGVALTELGFRQVDLGQVFAGYHSAGPGLYLMTIAWAVGAVGALVAVIAAVQERRRQGDRLSSPPAAVTQMGGASTPAPASLGGSSADSAWALPPVPQGSTGGAGGAGEAETAGDWPAPAQASGAAGDSPAQAPAPGPGAMAGPESPWAPTAGPESPWAPTVSSPAIGDQTTSMPSEDWSPDGDTAILATSVERVGGGLTDPPPSDGGATSLLAAIPHSPRHRPAVGPLILVGLLSLATAGAFLPAWDHYTGVASNGQSLGFSLGNAFSLPWQMIVGNVLAALAIALVPIGAYLMRSRGLAAAAVAGMLIVLSGQFASAVVQIGQAVPSSVTSADPNLTWHQSLTGWFTADILLAYGLFAVVMVLGHLRTVDAHESSGGTVPSAPDARSAPSLPWS